MEMVSGPSESVLIRLTQSLLSELIPKVRQFLTLQDPNHIFEADDYSLLSSFESLFNELSPSNKQVFTENECPWLPKAMTLDSIIKHQRFIELAEKWTFIQRNDDYRVEGAYKSGGLALQDQAVVSKIRSVGTEVLKQLGKKILSGNFNLTQISFPIRCMQASTALHSTLNTFQMIPLYVARAVIIQDHVERLKLVIVSVISSFLYTSTFEKPLNPILGETLIGELEDGTLMYAEQTSHHPPVSNFFVEGNGFRIVGYFNYTAKAGLNSVTVTNVGKRTFIFHDGYQVSLTCPEEVFSGTFFGTMRHESLGIIRITDSHGNNGQINFGKIKGKPSDYLQGTLNDAGGRSICKIEGTYLGFLEIDSVRYWDARYVRPFGINYKQVLVSDSENRKDIIVLRSGNVERAQIAKEELENLQRNDRKLRNKFHK